MTVREPEGVTLVLDEGEAQRSGLGYEYVAAMVTPRVHPARGYGRARDAS